MTALTLTKTYGDLELLFKSDIDDMWTELEAFTNGGITDDNVNVGWASFSQIELADGSDFYLGDGIIIDFEDDDLRMFFDEDEPHEINLKINGDLKVNIDNSGNFYAQDDTFFETTSNYSLAMLVNYCKPVLVYVDGTTVNLQQNVTVANRTLVVFPSGPIDVTEDVSSTHKFRQLKTSATANGYATGHTGAADSGMKSGLSLTENTWYFVYAAVVRAGDDIGNFIMVVDDTSPIPSNWSTLDSVYGAGNWVYLGPLRYGHGEVAATTLVPFVMDHQGWVTFIGAGETNNFFGIRLASTVVSTTSYDTIWEEQTGNEGESIPANFSAVKITYRPVDADDAEMTGQMVVTDNNNNILQVLPAFSTLLEVGEAHGYEVKIPTGIGAKLRGRIGA